MPQAAPQSVLALIERFERNLDSYRSPTYNEAQVRQEFINPFFDALGWDIANKEGSAEAYKDVIHEDAIKIGAPDYCFRIGGARKFFLEAKKPAVNVKDDPDPAYQLRRYAWSAKLPLSILTDFEEFAVYDCRTRPSPSDKASAGRIHYLTYKEYAARWDEIASVFSKDAVRKGSFDKYAVSERKRGTATVDAAFLAEIEKWRDALARNLAVRNTALDVHELNFAVQRTIDRIIFLRICEDRGIEPYAQLQSLLNGENIYARLRHLYDQADDRYNSGIFHFRAEKERAETPDELTPKLKIDDKVLKDIIHGLYYPESPYEFSVMPAEILGQVYEQFLGKVIRLTPGHQAKVEEKPEVKKAGGVYYTPAYIVDYIVRNTVGKLCEDKTPKQISKLKILDPACGSGSFLIGAYDYLVNYHRDWYLKDGPEKHTKEIYQGAGGLWHLTTQEKKRILLNNVYGVDIDSQAVEVTKLSLLLKVLEGENQETLKKQLKMWHERALPDLGRNIKCGNSLIGPDYSSDQLLPDDDEMRRVNPFDWKAEFSEIMKAGGFDAVIGNPPYVRPHNISAQEKEYFWTHYRTFTHKSDLYCCFIERSLSLIRCGGLFSYIVSHGWLRLHSFQELRRYLLEHAKLTKLVELPFKVFAEADVTTGVFVLEKGTAPKGHKIEVVLGEREGAIASFHVTKTIPQQIFRATFQNVFDLSISPETEAIKDQMRTGPRIGDYFDICFGLKTADDTKFLHKSKGLHREDRPLLRGDDIKRYTMHYKNEYVWYVPDKMRQNRKTARPGEPRRFEQPKVLVKDTSADFGCTFDDENFYVKDVLIVIPKSDQQNRFDLPFIAGVLNSRLMFFYYRTTFETLHVQNEELASLPLPRLDFDAKTDRARHDKLVQLVERMLDLHMRLAMAKAPDDKTKLQRQIDATDREIDRLVYDLYGLTEDEIAIVESHSN
jgi:hypothetical protein